MIREIYGKNGDKVVVLDVRDLDHGEYHVDVLLADGGYRTVYSSINRDKCINKAKQLLDRAIWSAAGTPIPNDCGGVIDFSK